jgi:hypothetical protein
VALCVSFKYSLRLKTFLFGIMSVRKDSYELHRHPCLGTSSPFFKSEHRFVHRTCRSVGNKLSPICRTVPVPHIGGAGPSPHHTLRRAPARGPDVAEHWRGSGIRRRGIIMMPVICRPAARGFDSGQVSHGGFNLPVGSPSLRLPGRRSGRVATVTESAPEQSPAAAGSLSSSFESVVAPTGRLAGRQRACCEHRLRT